MQLSLFSLPINEFMPAGSWAIEYGPCVCVFIPSQPVVENLATAMLQAGLRSRGYKHVPELGGALFLLGGNRQVLNQLLNLPQPKHGSVGPARFIEF